MRGFTLVEVVVAAVVLQVGLLAALSTLWLASSYLREAVETDRTVRVLAWVIDSLPPQGAPDSVDAGGVRVQWSPAAGGRSFHAYANEVSIVVPPADSVELRFQARAP